VVGRGEGGRKQVYPEKNLTKKHTKEKKRRIRTIKTVVNNKNHTSLRKRTRDQKERAYKGGVHRSPGNLKKEFLV